MKKHAVALIPGFIGFDHWGDRTYFADRFGVVLGAHLKSRSDLAVPVVPLSTLPVGNLADRQSCLLDELRRLDSILDRPQWHLVGHSTGGLDAALLGRAKQLRFDARAGISRFSPKAQEFDRIASITTLSAPLYGTTLALAPIARLSRGWRGLSLQAVKDLARASFDLTQRDSLASRIGFFLGSIGATGSLSAPTRSLALPAACASLLEVLFHDDLVHDLQPAVAGALMSQNNARRTAIPTFCFATVAPKPDRDPPDQFFADLWRWTAEASAHDESCPPPRFPARPSVISSSSASVPDPIQLDCNDGIVNTDRQHLGQVTALVLGDHADVLGRYRRTDILDGHPIDPGLLTSGAQFGDTEFLRLIELIAEGISSVIHARQPAAADVTMELARA